MKTLILEDSNLFADNFLSFIAERSHVLSTNSLGFKIKLSVTSFIYTT